MPIESLIKGTVSFLRAQQLLHRWGSLSNLFSPDPEDFFLALPQQVDLGGFQHAGSGRRADLLIE
jgi:hypothetical protein